MNELALDRFDAGMRDCLEAVRHALARVIGDPSLPPGDIPSSEETRELLGLFAKLQSEDLRQAVLGLMRTIVEATA